MVKTSADIFVGIPDELREWVGNRLVSAHLRILRALILGHLLNTFMIVAVFFGRVPTSLLFGWAGLVAVACLQRLAVGEGKRKGGGRPKPGSAIRALDYNSACMALLVGGALVWLMPYGTPMGQMLLGIVGATLMAAAGFTMRTLPRAAISYIGIISLAMVAALIRLGGFEAIAASVLLGASAVLLSRMALMAYNLFVIRIMRERELNESVQTVKMLLNDYEDHGSDWLFELDTQGSIIETSQRFADALGLETDDLDGRAFFTLFEESPERRELMQNFADRRAFRGLMLQLQREDGESDCWWSISGRPASGSAAAFRGFISDVSAERQADARVHHMAHYDSLTALPNRLMFGTALARAFKTDRSSHRHALLLIDVDHFKAVNDMYGHPVGDQFLKCVGERITACAKESELGGESHLVARLGGDEFAIVMGGDDAVDHAIRLAECLTEKLAKPYLLGEHLINSSSSIGIAIAPEHGDTPQILQRNADIALYFAKNNGRARWECFEPGMDVIVQQRHAIERDLRSALGNNEFCLYFQPLVDVQTGMHTGFEALLRWEHPERGMVMPDDFIAIAEETGLIVPIGEWVIRSALAEAASWAAPKNIAVNLSPVQMRSPNLLPTIINALAETGIAPERLEIEITEGVLLNDSEANIAVLHRLRDLGVKIALDDFGTGYSSLNYLRTFPFDKIKIDRSFIADLEQRSDCRAIVSAVISLANDLGMCTLAEGVENPEQLETLRTEGCMMVQGWLFGKAMPADHYQERNPSPALPTSAPKIKPIRASRTNPQRRRKAA